MAWEWIGTSAVGLAGIAATYWTGQRGRDQAEALADAKHTHDLALAREQRQQERQAEAYIELLTLVHSFSAHMARADGKTGAFPEGLPLPSADAQSRIKALLAAYGSTRSSALYQEWLDNLRSANNSRKRLANAYSSGQVEAVETHRSEFKAGRDAVKKSTERLGDQLASELNSHGRPLG